MYHTLHVKIVYTRYKNVSGSLSNLSEGFFVYVEAISRVPTKLIIPLIPIIGMILQHFWSS